MQLVTRDFKFYGQLLVTDYKLQNFMFMKKLLSLIMAILLVGAGAFYAGMKYGQSKNLATGRGAGFANLSPEERQARMQQFGADATGPRGIRTGDGFASGEILAKDETTITLKLPDGGSKIILYATSTPLMKFSTSTIDELKVGENITVNGTANQDGSITAQSIQIRPEPLSP